MEWTLGPQRDCIPKAHWRTIEARDPMTQLEEIEAIKRLTAQ